MTRRTGLVSRSGPGGGPYTWSNRAKRGTAACDLPNIDAGETDTAIVESLIAAYSDESLFAEAAAAA